MYHVASIDRGYMKKMWKEGLASVVLSALIAVFFASIGMLLRWPTVFDSYGNILWNALTDQAEAGEQR